MQDQGVRKTGFAATQLAHRAVGRGSRYRIDRGPEAVGRIKPGIEEVGQLDLL
jgi:hypothetical protein